MDDKEKGDMFTFGLGRFFDSRSTSLVIILKGKHKLKIKKDKDGTSKFSDYIDHKDYITMIGVKSFEKLFGKTIKPGKVRHGRLKLRLVKRKKKC